MEEQEQQNVVNEEQQDINQMEPTPLSEPPSHKKLIIGIVAVFVLVVAGAVGAFFVFQPENQNISENIKFNTTAPKLSGKIFYISDSTTSSRDTVILDFDRRQKFKIGVPFVYRGSNDQFLLVSPDKTKILLLGSGTSVFEASPLKITDLFVNKALAGVPMPTASLYIIDLEKQEKIKLVDAVLFNDYATTSPMQWIDNDSICYHEYRHTDPSFPFSGIVRVNTWQVTLDGLRKEILSEQCPFGQEMGSVTGWKRLEVNKNESLIKTDDGIYPLGKRWESTSIILQNNKNNQQKILVTRGSQLITSETFTLAPSKNAFLFETVRKGKTKMEKEGNEEIEVMSLSGEILLRIPGTYATWIP